MAGPPPACLILGRGSIGERHGRVLAALGHRVAFASRRAGVTLEQGLADGPGYVVVATETADHGPALARLAAAGYAGQVLVEKPLLAAPGALPAHRFASLHVGYNLRFHPLVTRLRAALAGRRALAAQFYVGQYLPEWRPGRDWRAGYSASAGGGGGALRDLSHELDLALWLLGPARRVAAAGGSLSHLATSADDIAALLLETRDCPAVTIQLNLLDRRTRREIIVVCDDATIAADLVAGTLTVDRAPPEPVAAGRDDSYAAMHQAVLGGGGDACTGAEGLAVVDLIACAEACRWAAP
ncbi:MAG: Gfo/Idh/MocA family oxidoreductase [Thalassobaculales bacterium]